MRTLGQIIAAISRRQPKDANALLHECDLPLYFLGDGAYRNVYEVVGSGYVLKVPRVASYKNHARVEVQIWRKVMRSKKMYKDLHPYMPALRHYSPSTGIVVMDKYDTTNVWRKYRKQMDEAERTANRVFGNYDSDLGAGKWDNFGLDATGQLKIIDLGYFHEDGI